MIGIKEGRIVEVFINMHIPKTIPAIPRNIDSFGIGYKDYYGL